MKVKTKETILAIALLIAIGTVFVVAGPFDEMFSSAGSVAVEAYDSAKGSVVDLVERTFDSADDEADHANSSATGKGVSLEGVASPLVSDDPEVMAHAAAMEDI